MVVADIEAAATGAEGTVALIRAAGGEAIYVLTDVSDEQQVQHLVELTVSTFGGLDFAFNNAGILAVGFTAAVEVEDFERIFDIDVKGGICGFA